VNQKTNLSRSEDDMKKSGGRRNHYIGRNRRNRTKEQEVCKELEKEDGQLFEKDRIVYVDGRIYVPNNQKIRERILQENHKPVNIEHPGQQ